MGPIQDGQKKKTKQKLPLGQSQHLASWSGPCPSLVSICLLFFCGTDLGRSHATACDSLCLSFFLTIRRRESTAALAPPVLDTSSHSPSISSPPGGLGAYGLAWQQMRETCQSVVLNKPIFHPPLLSLPPAVSFPLRSLHFSYALLFSPFFGHLLALLALLFPFLLISFSALSPLFFFAHLSFTYLSHLPSFTLSSFPLSFLLPSPFFSLPPLPSSPPLRLATIRSAHKSRSISG